MSNKSFETGQWGGVFAGTYKDGILVRIREDPTPPGPTPTPYTAPKITVSISPATTLYKQGDSAQITITARVTKGSEEIKQVQILAPNAVKTGTDLTMTHQVTLTQTTAIKATVNDGKSTVTSNVINVQFGNYIYWGTIQAGASPTIDMSRITEDLVKGLSTKNLQLNRTFSKTFQMINSHVIYAYPDAWGALTGCTDGMFNTLPTYTIGSVTIDGTLYKVYAQTKASTLMQDYLQSYT